MAAQPKNIVVGFDGSEGARRALEAAAHLIGYGSTLTVVSVDPSGAPTRRDALAEARDWLLDRLVTATYLSRFGDAGDELVAAAKDDSGQPMSNGARDIWVTETALTTALNVSYMAERLAVFGLVVGIALLLTGVGLVILALAVFGRRESVTEPAPAKPSTTPVAG